MTFILQNSLIQQSQLPLSGRGRGVRSDFIDKETVKGEIEGIKVDCIAHKYPWLKNPIEINGIRLAEYEDLAAMKLNAIVGNGTQNERLY